MRYGIGASLFFFWFFLVGSPSYGSDEGLGGFGYFWKAGGVLKYSIFLKEKKIGWVTVRLTPLPTGGWAVKSDSYVKISLLFNKVEAKNVTERIFSKDWELQKFRILSKVRKRERVVEGKLTGEGLEVKVKEGDKVKRGFFPKGSYQGTSLDLRYPTAPGGVSFFRNYLIIPELKLVEQKLSFRELPGRSKYRDVKYLELEVSGKGGKATYFLRNDGLVLASLMTGRLGELSFKLVKVELHGASNFEKGDRKKKEGRDRASSQPATFGKTTSKK